jgi:uncharacterized membrane-anchored protein YhcB (DUF1043 family)
MLEWIASVPWWQAGVIAVIVWTAIDLLVGVLIGKLMARHEREGSQA